MRETLVIAIKEAKFLFDKIKKLYPTFKYPDELDIEAWQEILEGFSHDDILRALKEYRKEVEYNTPPSIANFKKFLSNCPNETIPTTVIGEKMTDYATAFMQRDIKLNRCRHLLPTYQAAVRYIAEDMLSREMPTSEWRKLSFAERCEKAMKQGLFNQFDDVLILVCRQRSGKDYQFEANRETKPFNPNRASQYLGAHYRADEFSLVEGM